MSTIRRLRESCASPRGVPRWPLPSLLAALALTKVAALLVFSSGFLLTRVELTHKSACDDFSPSSTSSTGNVSHVHNGTTRGGGCWLDAPPPVDKVVLLIIDGARFDFAVPSRHRKPADSKHLGMEDEEEEKKAPLHAITELLNYGGVGTGELFKFVADPPTTTQQRLKGLLTGGLPTFVDVSNSFGGTAELQEDNVMVGRFESNEKAQLNLSTVEKQPG